MEQLKSSLALCLVHYYPWCGRIAKGAKPPHRLFIDCCDAGVEFVEASSHLPLSHLAPDGFPSMKPALCQLPPHHGDCLFSSPLLSIQATLFSDGGLALGIAHSHVVADGQSFWDFMVSWGECSRGVTLSLPPLHNREMLAVLDPSPDKATWSLNPQIKERYSNKGSCQDDEHKISSAGADSIINKDKNSSVEVEKDRIEENRSSTEDKGSGAGTIKDDNSNVETNASSGGGRTEPLVQCMFDLPAAAIKKLKSEAGGAHTSFEVTCAHFWKHVAAARETAMDESTYIVAPVNCRARMNPPLPSSYFGNVIAPAVILSTVGAIRKETLCATACRVHDTVAVLQEDFILGYMHWLETHNNSLADAFSIIVCRKGLNTANSPRFPVYRIDYGWGKPVAVRTVCLSRDGQLVLFGGRPGSMPGDVEICTALPESVLKRLLNDPAFLPRPPCSPLAND